MRRTPTEYDPIGLQMARDYEKCFTSMCHHVSNDEFYGQPFYLEEFQRENMWKPLFACGHMTERGFQRQYRRAVFLLPSGAGKTEFSAALVMTIVTMEPIFNGQYGVVASSKDQVRNIYEKIATQIKLNPVWCQQWEIGKNIITNKETGAKIMVLPNKPDALESWHFNVLIFDEMHVYKDSRVWDAGVKGQKVLWNPLTIGITTASDAREGFLWELLEKADNDQAMYVYHLGLNDDDDIDDKRSWKPIIEACSWITWESIQEQRGMAASKRSFERYTANRFPRNKNQYSVFKAAELQRCTKGRNDFDFDEPFTLGIDGATSGDSFALVAYQERKVGNRKVGFTREWIFDEPDTDTGHYDLTQIMELIATLYQEHYIEVVGIDPNRLIVMASQLERTYGIELTSFAQDNKTMCQAAALVKASVQDGVLRLRGCPKLKEHLSNTVEEDREPFGMRFGKDSKKSKIDGAIALAIAELAYHKLVEGTENYVPVS